MTETEKYEDLEDALIVVNYCLNEMTFWQRLFRRPSKEFHNAVDSLHKKYNVVSAHVEFCTVENRKKMLYILEKATTLFEYVLKKYPRLNHWGYLTK